MNICLKLSRTVWLSVTWMGIFYTRVSDEYKNISSVLKKMYNVQLNISLSVFQKISKCVWENFHFFLNNKLETRSSYE